MFQLSVAQQVQDAFEQRGALHCLVVRKASCSPQGATGMEQMGSKICLCQTPCHEIERASRGLSVLLLGAGNESRHVA